MGGADFVQWHGNYELLARLVELRAQAEELRRGQPPARPAADVAAAALAPARAAPARGAVRRPRTWRSWWLDIVLAHAVNAFGHPAEWIPLVFCVAGALALAVALVLGRRDPAWRAGRGLAGGVGRGSWWGWPGSCGTWRAGSSRSARCGPWSTRPPSPPRWPSPGLGLPPPHEPHGPPGSVEWGRWVAFLALGGYAGNLVLSLADHAQNGFFDPLEWVPVATAALATGTFLVLVSAPARRAFGRFAWGVLALQAAVGLLGFALHLRPAFHPSLAGVTERILYGPPVFAPLLFVNLALPGALALWDLEAKGWVGAQGASQPGAEWS